MLDRHPAGDAFRGEGDGWEEGRSGRGQSDVMTSTVDSDSANEEA
jgi:hypothetical protein